MTRKNPATSKELPPTVKRDDANYATKLADQAARLVEFAAKALVAAEKLGIQEKPLEHFWLAPTQRDVLLAAPQIPPAVKAKLKQEKASFTVAEVADMTMILAEAATAGKSRKQIAALLVAKHLTERLQAEFARAAEPKTPKSKDPKTKADPSTIYQFKITLLGTKPPIWRRIQVTDCTLDKLHEHIQTAVGWTNSHLHHFRIGEQLYGDPMLMEESMEELGYKDSTRTKTSKILPTGQPDGFPVRPMRLDHGQLFRRRQGQQQPAYNPSGL